ncbi:MAG: GNAT family N-acetyltransferase [Phycisphaerales bacterium]|nr:GNAT family N-acetyltransferase [Phycisphaerales bacterium]
MVEMIADSRTTAVTSDVVQFNPTPTTLELADGLIRLAPLELDHAAALRVAGADDQIWRYMPMKRPISQDEFRGYVQTALGAQAAGNEVPFAIIDRPSERAIGTTRFMDIQRANRGLEIGHTWITADFRRSRVNTECKFLLLQHAFESLRAVRVQLKTDHRNHRSQTAILRIGAKFEGRLRKHRILHDGFLRDTMMYSITDDEWPLVRDRLAALLAGPARG